MTPIEPERVPTPDGTTIAIRRLAGEGPLVVFLHGFTGDGSTMSAIAEGRLHRPGLLVDLVGHGASDAPTRVEPYAMDAVVDQVLSMVGMHPPGSVHLVGYSLGGRVALSIAARAPWYFASITAISTTAGIEAPDEREARHAADHALADTIEADGVDQFVDHWLGIDLFQPLRDHLDEAELATTRAQRTTNTAVGLANSLRGTGTGSMPPVWDRLLGLQSPLLAIAGAQDPKYCEIAHKLAATAPRGTATIVEGAGHALPLENPHAVATELAAFLESCEASKAIDWPQ